MNLFNRNKKPKQQISGQDEAILAIKHNAQLFVDEATDSQLDYSVQSLSTVDTILDEASQHDLNDQAIKQAIKTLMTKAGSYIFEVAVRKYGGKVFWYDKFDQPILVIGQPQFEVSFLAYQKVQDRLKNGKEDAIPFYFEGIENYIREQRSALIT